MSHNLLRTFLNRFSVLSEADKKALLEKLVMQTFPKGTVLQKEGQVPDHCYYVLKGCVRQYQILDGLERTTDLYTPDHGTVSADCYVHRSPSYFYLECVEETLLLVGERDRDRQLYAEHPVLQQVILDVMQAEWLKSRKSLTRFKFSSPEERYLHLMKHRTDLLHRVPNHQIASYLGITPESLSRIRRRISQRSNV
ncbi:MAG: Crp/Fnr family transcriptional regulator [Saprospiraceae bacterium]|nr:Crp/Fnr family transcriptional regulator [Saprospiraceae bacterium]